ncbi:hypothetical protein NPIL_564411 [Nephila pilipes]|uniref:Uncharacterized protein n=1 Tax=Nephila pilipes TaxID=299642 RepID=A0A8X6PPR7_NEPPI|nr:hypothetical protein NPIL_564411 [Nephila pilipes]
MGRPQCTEVCGMAERNRCVLSIPEVPSWRDAMRRRRDKIATLLVECTRTSFCGQVGNAQLLNGTFLKWDTSRATCETFFGESSQCTLHSCYPENQISTNLFEAHSI